MNTQNELIIPKEVAIETIFGCNLKCQMCSIDLPTPRKKGVMSTEHFHFIVDALIPYKDEIERINLFGLGEPLLDPKMFERIRYLKQRNFKNIGFSTNAMVLNKERREHLLESGIDTVIFSIDGAQKETHEEIRKGAKFEQVVENVEEIIKLRDVGDFATRFVIRFIRQESNYDEWEPFKAFWNARLSQDKRDFVSMYDVHNNSGTFFSKSELAERGLIDEVVERKPCHFVFDMLIILADGSLAMCHPDFHKPNFDFPKIPDVTPIEAFNSEEFQRIRALHTSGRKTEIPLCNECTILYSETTREVGWEIVEN